MTRFSSHLIVYTIPAGCVLLLLAAFLLLSDRPGGSAAPAPDTLEVLTSEDLAPVLKEVAARFHRRTGVQVTVGVFHPPVQPKELFDRAEIVVASAQHLPRSAVSVETASATPWLSFSPESATEQKPLFIWIVRTVRPDSTAYQFARFLADSFATGQTHAHSSIEQLVSGFANTNPQKLRRELVIILLKVNSMIIFC